MAKVESFTLDHDAVKAPYVRLAGRETGPKGDVISKYDIRLTQPNTSAVSTAAMHTLEHLLAAYIRDYLDNVIDISPMGCRTGFYMTVWGDLAVDKVAKAYTKVLRDIVNSEWQDVQGTKRKECGNYKDHSLFGAKEYASLVLAEGLSTDPFERKVVKLEA